MSSESSSISSIQSIQSMGLSAVSLLDTAASARSSYLASSMRSNMFQFKAEQQELQARQEKLKGVQTSNLLREQLLSNLSSANALFSSRGIDVGSKSAQNLISRNVNVSRKDINLLQSNAQIQSIGSEINAIGLRTAAKNEKTFARAKLVRQISGAVSQRAISSLLGGI